MSNDVHLNYFNLIEVTNVLDYYYEKFMLLNNYITILDAITVVNTNKNQNNTVVLEAKVIVYNNDVAKVINKIPNKNNDFIALVIDF